MTKRCSSDRRYSRVAVVLWLGLLGYLGGGVLCDVHCEAEFADNADFALAARVVGSAEPRYARLREDATPGDPALACVTQPAFGGSYTSAVLGTLNVRQCDGQEGRGSFQHSCDMSASGRVF